MNRKELKSLQTTEEKTPLKSKLQGHMFRRNGSQEGRREFSSNQRLVKDSVDQVKILVEDVEKKIKQIERDNSRGSHSTSHHDARSMDLVAVVKPRDKLCRGVSSTDASTIEG